MKIAGAGRSSRASRRAAFLACALAMTLLVPFAGARADRESPPGTLSLYGASLVLNGYGEREHWWTDVYRCALYLPQRSSQLSYILDPAVPKALRLRVLYGDIPERMPQEWRTMFKSELNRELFGRLKAAYSELEDNDLLVFTYSPRQGSEVWVNGRRLLKDTGHGLMEALLNQWVGGEPVSQNLRRLLLSSRN